MKNWTLLTAWDKDFYEFIPGVLNRWKSMIGKAIDQTISIDKIS